MVKEKLVLYYYSSSRCTESQCVLLSCLCLSILNVIFKIEGPDPAVLLSGVVSPVHWNISIEGFKGWMPSSWKEKHLWLTMTAMLHSTKESGSLQARVCKQSVLCFDLKPQNSLP